MSSQKQPSKSVVVEMDSRKLLAALNQSSQSKVALFENIISKLGSSAKQNWKLAALLPNQLYIEDVNSGEFYLADHSREKGGQINITNIKQVRVVEEQKQNLFGENCLDLVECIDSGDNKGLKSAFNRMASQRFTSRTIPTDGIVRTRDGVVRKIAVSEGIVEANYKSRIVQALSESVTNRVILENGRIISATIGSEAKIRLPINEWTVRKSVARSMRTVAENAHRSVGFQNRIKKMASLISEGNIKEAAEFMKPFLADKQEFCLLNYAQTKDLVGKALACNAIFNEKLCESVSNAFFSTNARANKNDIVRDWSKVAKKVGNSALLENVSKLAKAPNFAKSYNSFLNVVFEAVSPRDVTVDAYKTALKMLQGTPKIQEAPELSSKIENLITKLSESEVDHSVISEVEDILAGAKSEIDANSKLDNFDQIETGAGAPEAGAGPADPLGAAVSQAYPNITINAPLISIGGNGAADAPDDGLDDIPELDMGGESGDTGDAGMADDDMSGATEDDLMNIGNEGGDDEFKLESKSGRRTVSEEWEKPWEKKDKEDKEDCDEDEEDCDDEYSFKEDVNVKINSNFGYGLTEAQISRIVDSMIDLSEAIEDDMDQENVRSIAARAMELNGDKVDSGELDSTIDKLSKEFGDRLNEDQYKTATKRRRRNPRRASLMATESKVTWLNKDSKKKGMLGEMNGTKFVLDYATAPTVIDVATRKEFAVPQNMLESAFGDTKAFGAWLAQNVIKEAKVVINTTPQGGLDIEMFSDELGQEAPMSGMDEVAAGMDDMGGMDDDMDDDFGAEEASMDALNGEGMDMGDDLNDTDDLGQAESEEAESEEGEIEAEGESEEESDEDLTEAVVRLTTNNDAIDVEIVSGKVGIQTGGGAGGDAGDIDMAAVGDEVAAGMGDMDDMGAGDEMAPIGAGEGDMGDDMDSGIGDDMDSGMGDEMDSDDFGGAPEVEDDSDAENAEITEDKDVTDPSDSDYDTTGEDVPVKPKVLGKPGNSLEGFDLKDGKSAPTMTKPKTGENRI